MGGAPLMVELALSCIAMNDMTALGLATRSQNPVLPPRIRVYVFGVSLAFGLLIMQVLAIEHTLSSMEETSLPLAWTCDWHCHDPILHAIAKLDWEQMMYNFTPMRWPTYSHSARSVCGILSSTDKRLSSAVGARETETECGIFRVMSVVVHAVAETVYALTMDRITS